MSSTPPADALAATLRRTEIPRIPFSVPGRPTLVLRAGDGFCIPPGTPHNALDLGPDTGVMLSTYLVDVGEPLSSVAAAPS